MENAFRTVLNMSLTGSYVILAVLMARLLLKKAPRKYSYALWAAAAFRLCCPVSFESILSLFRLPVFDMTTAQASNAFVLSYIPENPTGSFTTGIAAVNSHIPPAATPTPAPAPVDWMELFDWIWCFGMTIMVLYSLMSYLLLRRKLAAAIRAEDNVYESDAIPSPFILGFFRPRICLPTGLTAIQRDCVLAHERMHLKRFDHLVKPFAYGLLVMHWFNPLCHLAFHLMSKDIETSCDEAVLARETALSRDYSATLVSLSVRPTPLSYPLAFGETGVRARVKHILVWKKPKVWVSLAAAAVCLVSLVACAANPTQTDIAVDYRPFDLMYSSPSYSFSHHYITAYQTEYRITDAGQLYRKDYDEEWTLLGTLEEFELTEENFDNFFPHTQYAEDGYTVYHFYNGEALRKRVVSAKKVEVPYDTGGVISYDRQFYYVLQTDNGEIYIGNGFSKSNDPSYGVFDKLVCMIPKSDTAVPLDAETYVTSRCVYQSPVFSIPMRDDTGYTYSVENDLLMIRHRQSNSLQEAFILTGLQWEDFPFTEEEWNRLSFSTDYGYFKDSRFLDISLRYFLLEKDGTLYLCEGYHNPDTLPSTLSTIYQLTPEGSEDDPWVAQFAWYDKCIRDLAASGLNPDGSISSNSVEYELLTIPYDSDMVLWYCFSRFLRGSETGPEGKVMAAICKQILYHNGEADIIGHPYINGQDWFDQYNAQAKGYLNTLGANTLLYVKHYLGIQ